MAAAQAISRTASGCAVALSISWAEGQKSLWASPHPPLQAECLPPRGVAFQKGWIFMHPLKTGGKTARQKVGRRISLGLSAGGMSSYSFIA